MNKKGSAPIFIIVIIVVILVAGVVGYFAWKGSMPAILSPSTSHPAPITLSSTPGTSPTVPLSMPTPNPAPARLSSLTIPINVSFSPAVFNFSIARGQDPNFYPNGVARLQTSRTINWTDWTWSLPISTSSIPCWIKLADPTTTLLNGAPVGVSLDAYAGILPPGTYTDVATLSPIPGTNVVFNPSAPTITVNLTVTSSANVTETSTVITYLNGIELGCGGY